MEITYQQEGDYLIPDLIIGQYQLENMDLCAKHF